MGDGLNFLAALCSPHALHAWRQTKVRNPPLKVNLGNWHNFAVIIERELKPWVSGVLELYLIGGSDFAGGRQIEFFALKFQNHRTATRFPPTHKKPIHRPSIINAILTSLSVQSSPSLDVLLFLLVSPQTLMLDI